MPVFAFHKRYLCIGYCMVVECNAETALLLLLLAMEAKQKTKKDKQNTDASFFLSPPLFRTNCSAEVGVLIDEMTKQLNLFTM